MRRFNSLLKENAELLDLTSKSGSLTAVQTVWNGAVPAPLAPFTHAGAIKHKRLTVYAHNGAIAAKIKLLLPSLLGKLQKQGLEVTAIRVEVQVQPGQRRVAKKHRHLSTIAASSIGDLAEKLEGSALGHILARLASRR